MVEACTGVIRVKPSALIACSVEARSGGCRALGFHGGKPAVGVCDGYFHPSEHAWHPSASELTTRAAELTSNASLSAAAAAAGFLSFAGAIGRPCGPCLF